MQTVILGSERFDCLAGLLERDPGDTPAVYVPTAADVLDDRAYVQEEIRRLAGMGFPVTALPLAGASRERVTAQLRRARLVFVTGGNAFHLLHHAMLSGFTELVPPLVRCGVLIYVGMSADAHLATPDLLPCVSEDTRWKAPGLAATTAMGLVSFSVLAHYGDPDRADRHRRLLAAPHPRRIVLVTDAAHRRSRIALEHHPRGAVIGAAQGRAKDAALLPATGALPDPCLHAALYIHVAHPFDVCVLSFVGTG